jgi:hypothetical protein
MKRIVLAAVGVVAMAASAWAQTPSAKPDEKTLFDAYNYTSPEPAENVCV